MRGENESEQTVLPEKDAREEMKRLTELAQKVALIAMYVLDALPLDARKMLGAGDDESMHETENHLRIIKNNSYLNDRISRECSLSQTTAFTEEEDGVEKQRMRKTVLHYYDDSPEWRMHKFPLLLSSDIYGYTGNLFGLIRGYPSYRMAPDGQITLMNDVNNRVEVLRTLINEPNEIRFIGGMLRGMLREVEEIRKKYRISPYVEPTSETASQNGTMDTY